MRTIILIFLVPFFVHAQKQRRTFRLPAGATRSHFASSHVLVKLKKEHSQIFNSGKTNPIGHLVKWATPMISEGLQRKNRARLAPRVLTSKIDPAHYFEIGFDGNDIEAFINLLYATGYFEWVEPDYIAQMHIQPNDERLANQYYLNRIRAFEAWDITQGSADLVIGIVDSGGDLNHPDLASKLYVNSNDPVDNVDNDNDGFTDNYWGWDFMGDDTLNISNSSFIGDNNPNNPNGGAGSHGSAVAGCAAAATNNGIGIAGVGFNTKILFTKHAADNQGTKKGGIYKGYNGIVYAASHGAKIINCSWGGSFHSQIYQDLITYVTLDLGCLVVASAGNDGTTELSYPAAYDYVLSVAASDQSDEPTSFTNYGKTIDITAPGKAIQTTFFDNAYTVLDGTSFSSPIAAGAAALVWANNPALTAIQLAEQLRVTADPIIYKRASSDYTNGLGKGRLDILQALTKQFPSIRAANPRLVNANGTVAEPGQEGFLSMDFTNILSPSTAGLTITVTPMAATPATIPNGTIHPGQLGTGQTINNKLDPISVQVNPNLPTNTSIDLIITYADGEYHDFQFLSFIVNPSFMDVDDNSILTTLGGNGRLGFEDTESQKNGSGFVFNNNKLLYEMGLILGTSTARLFNNVRGVGGGFDQDFVTIQKIKEITPGERSFSEIFGSISDNGVNKTVAIDYRSLVWKEKPYDQFIILEYTVKNISALPLTDFYFGLFADWDITDEGGGDVAGWDANLSLGYVHPALPDDKPYAGIKILAGNAPQYFPIDNDQNTPGTPFGIYDGFTDAEKFQTISSGVARETAGATSGTGNDVSHVVGTGPFNIAANGEIKVTFALVAGVDWGELKQAAQQADTAYNYMLKATPPAAAGVNICFGNAATVSASGASQLNWYADFTGGEPIYHGPSFTTAPLFADTVFFVSNADKDYESVRTAAPVFIRANPSIFTSGSTTVCQGDTVTLSVAAADTYRWSTGATTASIDVTEGGHYSVTVTDQSLACNSDSEPVIIFVNPTPHSEFQTEDKLTTLSPVVFTNKSIGASQYLWSFGDGQTSTEENPSHLYLTVQNYTVALTTKNDFGCSNTAIESISVITGLETQQPLQIFPVPFDRTLTIQSGSESFQYQIMDGAGKIYRTTMSSLEPGTHTIHLSDLPPGLYFISISNGTSVVKRKIIKH